MSRISADEYQRLLVEHGVPVELPGAEVSQRLCDLMTSESTTNRVVTRDSTVRNAVFFGRFSSGNRHYLILPPDKRTIEAVRDAVYVEHRRWDSQFSGASKILRAIDAAAEKAGIQLGPRSTDALSGQMDKYLLEMPQWKAALRGEPRKSLPRGYVIHVGIPFDSRHTHVWGMQSDRAVPAIKLKGRGVIGEWAADAEGHRLMRSFKAERCATCDAEVWTGDAWIGRRQTYTPLVEAFDKALEKRGGIHKVSEEDLAEIQGDMTERFGEAALEFERQIVAWSKSNRYVDDAMLWELNAKLAKKHGHTFRQKKPEAAWCR